MTFKDIKQGYPVYVLRKGEKIEARTGKATMVGQAKFPGQYGTGNALGMVVDITVEEEGTARTYTVPADSSVASAGNVVLSVDREGILKDVEAMKAESEEVIASVEKHRARAEECEVILTEWNPALAEKKRQEERIGSLERGVGELKDMMKALVSKLG